MRIPKHLDREQLFLIFFKEEALFLFMLIIFFILIQQLSLAGFAMDTCVFLYFLKKNRSLKRNHGEQYVELWKLRYGPHEITGNKRFIATHIRELVG